MPICRPAPSSPCSRSGYGETIRTGTAQSSVAIHDVPPGRMRETEGVESDTVAAVGAGAAVPLRSRITHAIKTEEPSSGGTYY